MESTSIHTAQTPPTLTEQYHPICLKRVLVAYDQSDQAGWAVELAASWASKLGAAIGLLHVMAPLPIAAVAAGEISPKLRIQAASGLLDAARSSVPDAVAVERMIREGDAAEQIVATAREWKADLVVLGTHGRRGLERLVLGSVAAAVVKRALCPVLCVGHKFSDEPLRRILVPVDRSPQSAWAVELACVLANANSSHMQLLHVTPFPGPLEPGYGIASEAMSEALQTNAHEYLKTIQPKLNTGDDVDRVVREGTTVNQILLTAANYDAQLIVMGAFSKHGIAGFVLGSTASAILRRSSCPVMCISHDPHRC